MEQEQKKSDFFFEDVLEEQELQQPEHEDIEFTIKTDTGHDFKIQSNTNDSVKSVKEKFYSLQGVPVENQILEFQGYELEDDNKIYQYCIKNSSQIKLVSVNRNMGGTAFNNLQKAKKGRLAYFAPRYRVITRGMNLMGYCKNEACVAYNLEGVGQIGFKKEIRIAEQKLDTKCNVCKGNLKNIKNVVFYKCKWTYFGKRMDKEDPERGSGSHTTRGGYLTFEETQESDTVLWEFLNFDVEKL